MKSLGKIFVKINIKNIVTSHWETLVNDNTKKQSFDDYLTFIIVPIIISGFLVAFRCFLKDTAINILITTLSIIIGLLFNVIVIIFDIVKRNNRQKIKNKILEQLLANISYTIVISIFTIIVTLFTYIDNEIVRLVTNFIIYSVLVHFLFTVLMILKRMYIIFSDEIKDLENDKGGLP